MFKKNLILAVLLVSTSFAGATPNQTVKHQSFDGMQYARDYLNMWNSRNLAQFPHYFSPDATYVEMARDETYTGLEDIVGFLKTLSSKYPDVVWEPLDVIVESPERIAIHWRATRTINGTLNIVEGVSIQYLEAGKIVRNIDFRK